MSGDSLVKIEFKFYGSEQEVAAILKTLVKLGKHVTNPQTVQITRK